MSRCRLAAYTIALPHMTPEQAVKAVRAGGYSGIQWSVHFHAPEISRQPSRLHRNNLCFIEPTRDALRRARELSEAEGLEIFGLGLGGRFNRIEGVPQAFELA